MLFWGFLNNTKTILGQFSCHWSPKVEDNHLLSFNLEKINLTSLLVSLEKQKYWESLCASVSRATSAPVGVYG